ncbi:MAG: hypothetical protein LUD57_04390 [Ruminococcus sp.]|nr:hypothetical protein [Ruminococcus sp.]
MDYRKIVASALMFSMLTAAAGCGDESSGSSIADGDSVVSSADSDEKLVPPTPVEASDENTVTFDDGDCSFAEVICDDDYSAEGEISVVEVQGNKMLKFTDSGNVELSERVQKIRINAISLIGAENLDKVSKIEFGVYADATAELLENEDGELVKAPGWIGGGGGTVTADDDKWYDFSEFSGGEYNFEMSGAVHVQFKFLLAASGQKWSAEMEDANFLIMRWELQNESNMYIDNIVFYDEDGNSIPLVQN